MSLLNIFLIRNSIEDDIESESESDYDTTDDEFDERFISCFLSFAFLWIYIKFHFSHCTAEIINISDHEADQHDELKKWALENQVPDITDKEKDAIDDFVLDVFEVHVPTTVLLELQNNNNILFLLSQA